MERGLWRGGWLSLRAAGGCTQPPGAAPACWRRWIVDRLDGRVPSAGVSLREHGQQSPSFVDAPLRFVHGALVEWEDAARLRLLQAACEHERHPAEARLPLLH